LSSDIIHDEYSPITAGAAMPIVAVARPMNGNIALSRIWLRLTLQWSELGEPGESGVRARRFWLTLRDLKKRRGRKQKAGSWNLESTM
jgi:hypothetical protein